MVDDFLYVCDDAYTRYDGISLPKYGLNFIIQGPVNEDGAKDALCGWF